MKAKKICIDKASSVPNKNGHIFRKEAYLPLRETLPLRLDVPEEPPLLGILTNIHWDGDDLLADLEMSDRLLGILDLDKVYLATMGRVETLKMGSLTRLCSFDVTAVFVYNSHAQPGMLTLGEQLSNQENT